MQVGTSEQIVLDECFLLKSLKCDWIVHCEDVFKSNDKLMVVLEMMDAGDFVGLVKQYKTYSEDFCKYTLYCVA